MIDDEAAEHAAGVCARLRVCAVVAAPAGATLVHAAPSARIATVSLRSTASS
jgi:hypothetical protein